VWGVLRHLKAHGHQQWDEQRDGREQMDGWMDGDGDQKGGKKRMDDRLAQQESYSQAQTRTPPTTASTQLTNACTLLSL